MGSNGKIGSGIDWPTLARIRRSRRISLRRISATTKIRPHYLKAIEQGRFGDLPGGVYTTSYIRQYARAIDFDEEDLLARFRLRTAAATPAEACTTPQGPVAELHDSARLWLWISRREKTAE